MKRILVVGGGSIGERHLRCFLNTNRAQVALCDVNAELCEDVANRYELLNTFSALDNALQEPFDAAVICTPAHLHIPMAQQLAEHGVPLLIEKPLSVQLNGVAELASAMKQGQLPVSVAYVLRQHPGLQALKAAVQSGDYGRPVQFVFTGGQHFPFYRPAYRDIYYTRHETGGGAIQDALTHVMNAAEWLVGPITKLVADAQHCVLEGVDVEDTVNVITRHADVLGSFSLNQHQPPNEFTATIICERGAVRFELHSSRWLSCTEANAEWTIESEFDLARDDLFTRQANAFLDQLETGGTPSCSLDEARQTLRVNIATLESVRTGRWVEIKGEQNV